MSGETPRTAPLPAGPSGPPVRGRSVDFCEAVRGGPWAVRGFAQGGPCPPPYRGDHGPGHLVTGVQRRVSTRVHPCHRPVLVGLDGDRCGLPVAVDPFALTPQGEVAALTAGLVTYDLDLGELHPRTHWTIPGRPPAADRPVLAEHRCSSPLPFGWRAPTVTPTAATPTEGPMF